MPGWALLTGSGKDATLALLRAREEGIHVTCALALVDVGDRRVRFHGTHAELVGQQARALGLDPRIVPVAPDGFDVALTEALAGLVAEEVEGVVLGNVHLADVRAWYEERTRAAGLQHLEPLWGEDPTALVREVVDRGVRATVVCVETARADRRWLGRPFDAALLEAILDSGVDPCGERGEYHTFVHDGPGFSAPVPHVRGGTVERDGFRTLELDPIPPPPA